MYKSKSGAGSKLKALALVPMVALALGVATVPAVKAAVSTISNSEVSLDKGSENSPSNQIGSASELDECYPELRMEVLNRIRFPQSLEKEGINAIAIVEFTINAKGNLVDAKILKPSGYDLFDAEVLRAVNSVNKKWIPRKNNGKAVSMTYQMPITFKTKGDATTTSQTLYVTVKNDTNANNDDIKSRVKDDKTVIVLKADNPSAATLDDMEIYLDGRKISEDEMKALDPETLAGMSIDKQNNSINLTSK